MDHQVLTECYNNHVQHQGWNLPVDMTKKFSVTKLDKGWRSYYQNDHFQDMDERRFGCVKGCDCPDPWQQQTRQGSKRDRRSSGSGMQAVFLSRSLPSSHSTKGSVGTGVFLPLGTRNAIEPTKKSGCSTVLLPAGVIQALKLHFDRIDRQSHCHSNTQQCSCHCSSPMQRGMHSPSVTIPISTICVCETMENQTEGAFFGHVPAYAMANNRNGYDNAQQRLRFQMAAALWSQDSDDSNEGLPQEWTY